MNNIMNIDGHRAVISFDPETEQFRGSFLGLNGVADFSAMSVAGLMNEGATSLRIFMETCAERGINPIKTYSGKFNARIRPDLHLLAAEAAAARGVSLNQLVEDAIAHEVSA